ncbi:TIGR02285 family protein [Salidesulfovibrio onnuriiensis]|uniref:TIGR02285 family protein n=1 Tax=Salidesulfovibrio onnuriiensis TaxID=2583823 RepID=UPI0011CCA526|nr:TIGR02285 family protein [Salidesulfovibrio onnuriiensis]
MPRTMLVAVLLVGVVFAALARADEKELVWCCFDAPPMYILSEPLKGTGYVDKFQDALFAAMDGYAHRTMECNIARTLEAMFKTTNTCNAVLLYTEDRDEFVHYSEPIIGLMPNRLLVLSENIDLVKPFLTEQGVDLGRLLRESGLSVGVLYGRSYGHYIDRHLEQAEDMSTVQWFAQSTLGVRQLLGKRLDALLAYAHEVVYYMRTFRIDAEIKSFPIIGETLINAHVGCSDSRLGREAVTEINRLLDGGLRGVYLRSYLEWADEDARQKVRDHVAGWPGVE